MFELKKLDFLKLKDIVGDKKTGVAPLIPVSTSMWLRGVKEGYYPKPIKLGKRAIAWKSEDIQKLILTLKNS